MADHIGQRLSLKSQTCTVRYIGSVANKSGEWLGVEWDDPLRGKHNGVYDGVTYFTCRSASTTAASFLRPDQPWDKSRSFLQALREKYASKAVQQDAIYFSTKQAEEVGFAKFAARQAELRGIHVVVLDRMCIRHRTDDAEDGSITAVCSEVTDLDIGGNLFETIEEVYALCRRLPKLRSLTLDGNRFSIPDRSLGSSLTALPNVRTLRLSNVLMVWDTEVTRLLRDTFPGLHTLVANGNAWTTAAPNHATLPKGLKTLDLSGNAFTALAGIGCVANSAVETLILKNNSIAHLRPDSHHSQATFPSVRELDIRHNNLATWTFFNSLPTTLPNLIHLRTTNNPLYENLVSADGKFLLPEDGYMLTIARLPLLQTLNYSKITEKERLNAEIFYLNQIALESSLTASDALAQAVRAGHPRWQALCEEYGEPAIKRTSTGAQNALDPNSLAARLIMLTFTLTSPTITHTHTDTTWTDSFPQTASIYAVLGAVGKRLAVMPLQLRLVWETGERDPLALNDGNAPEWWDSSDDEAEGDGAVGAEMEMGAREVELVAGTRALGTWVEGQKARVRVEVR
ncbi:hypothetical protein LTR08_006897 [Meristemomyces frigidus]|nr:hypothetical protein LTR08_006897 [Meristemomyces frigidus]